MTTRDLSATVKWLSLPTCWVKDGEKYIFVKKGGKIIQQNLPCISIRYEKVLKDLQIPYEVIQLPNLKSPGKIFTACTFWNPDFYWVQNYTLPVYQRLEGKPNLLVRTGEMHEGKIFGQKMISKAMALKEVVMEAVEEVKRAQEKKPSVPTKVDAEFLRNALDGKTARVMQIANAEIDHEVKSGNIQIIPAYNSKGEESGYYGIFDMSKLQYVPVIKVVVPTAVCGMIYGKSKQNLQYWEHCCGREIHLIPYEG